MVAKASPKASIAAAIAELNHQAPSRQSNFEARRATFMRTFKTLPSSARKEVFDSAAQALKTRFENLQTPDDLVLLVASAIACERDWESASSFLESLLTHISSGEAFQDIVLSFLEIADNELTEERSKLPLGQTALVLTTELGLMLANRSGKSALDFKGVTRVVEYITSSLLARSNINDVAIRVSLVHYLARCPLNNHATSQLNRVMARFGQSLLDDLLHAYFEDKKRGSAAFHFLVQYLNIFFVASPGLSQMAHDVLKHYMLKYPDEFPALIAGYCERIPKEEIRLAAISQHLALLLNAAIEVSRRPLAEGLSEILLHTVERFRDISPTVLETHILITRQILAAGSHKNSPISFVAENFVNRTRALTHATSSLPGDNVVRMGKTQKSKKTTPPHRLIRFAEAPTPLETMLALAS